MPKTGGRGGPADVLKAITTFYATDKITGEGRREEPSEERACASVCKKIINFFSSSTLFSLTNVERPYGVHGVSS